MINYSRHERSWAYDGGFSEIITLEETAKLEIEQDIRDNYNILCGEK